MIVYIDTGVFFDYFIYRSHARAALRTTRRRNRTLNRLARDADSCFHRLSTGGHNPITSTLTLFELEHAVFEELERSTSGVSHRTPFLVTSARATITQGLVAAGIYNIQLLELTHSVVSDMLANVDLQVRGVQAADSLHIASAIGNNAEMIISTDRHMLRLDNTFLNPAGQSIRCVDTDEALTIL